MPRLHPDPWPSYFELGDSETSSVDNSSAFGIAQKWRLKAKVASFAEDVLIVKDMALEPLAIHGGATCEAIREFEPTDITVKPKTLSLSIPKSSIWRKDVLHHWI